MYYIQKTHISSTRCFEHNIECTDIVLYSRYLWGRFGTVHSAIGIVGVGNCLSLQPGNIVLVEKSTYIL